MIRNNQKQYIIPRNKDQNIQQRIRGLNKLTKYKFVNNTRVYKKYELIKKLVKIVKILN